MSETSVGGAVAGIVGTSVVVASVDSIIVISAFVAFATVVGAIMMAALAVGAVLAAGFFVWGYANGFRNGPHQVIDQLLIPSAFCVALYFAAKYSVAHPGMVGRSWHAMSDHVDPVRGLKYSMLNLGAGLAMYFGPLIAMFLMICPTGAQRFMAYPLAVVSGIAWGVIGLADALCHCT